MSVPLAVALLALLVALFALVALVAVYARVRALEAGRTAGLTGYAALVGRQAPASIRPRSGERVSLVAVLDADCALCHGVWEALATAAIDPVVRHVALVDRATEFGAHPGDRAQMLADGDARAELFEGYSPTLLAVDAAGVITHRSFVYADTDLPELLFGLGHTTPEHDIKGHEVSRA